MWNTYLIYSQHLHYSKLKLVVTTTVSRMRIKWTPCTQLQTWHLLHPYWNIKTRTSNNEIIILFEWYIVTIDLYPEKVTLIFFNFIWFYEIVLKESICNSSCQTGHNSSLCSNSELHEEYWCRHGSSAFILIRTIQTSQRKACQSWGRTKLPSLKQHYDSEHNIRPSVLTSVPHMVVNALKVV